MENRTALILAGGKSERMGEDKGLMRFDGLPLVQRIADQLGSLFSEILICTDNREGYGFLNLPMVPDREAGRGPLMGIYSGLCESSNELNFVIACDIPEIDKAFLDKLFIEAEKADLVIPESGPGKFEPLFAVYRKSLLPVMADLLENGENKISALFEKCRVTHPDMSGAAWYRNINTQKDFKAL